MSTTSWNHGPSYTPFMHTSNSQYGRWSGTGTRVNMMSASAKTDSIINPRKPLIPAPPARIGDTAGNEATRTFSLSRTSEVIPKYGSVRMNPGTSQDRIETVSEREISSGGLNRVTLSGTNGTSGYDISYGSSNVGMSNRKYNTLPSRSLRYMNDDLGLYRSHTTMGTQPNNHAKYIDSNLEGSISKAHDSINRSGYKTNSTTLDVMSSLTRSQSFHGTNSLRSPATSSAYNGYSDQRVGYENILGDSSKQNTEHQISLSNHTSVPFTDITQETNNSVSKALIPKPPSAIARGNVDIGRENEGMHKPWLQSAVGSGAKPPGHQQRPFTPYRPGDYVFRTESSEISRRYGANSGTLRNEVGPSEPPTDHNVLEPHKDRNWYSSGRGPSYRSPERTYEDTYSKDSYGSGVGFTTDSVPEIISTTSGVGTRSILKKGSGSASATDSIRLAYGRENLGYSTGKGMYAQSTHPLPPLPYSTPQSGTIKRSTSGKRVTFNMALNRSRHILD